MSNNGVSLFKDTLFYSFANWGRRIVSFITAPVIIAYLTPSDFGYISLVNTIATFCSILGLLAIVDQGLPRFFIDSQTMEEKRGYVASSIFISLLGLAGVTVVILFSTPFLTMIFKDIQQPSFFTLLIIFTCLAQSIYYVGSNLLKWTFQSTVFMKLSFLHAIIGAGLTVGGIVLLDFRAPEVIVIGFLTTLGAGAVSNFCVKTYIKFHYISKAKMKELFYYSWPLLGLNIFAFFTRSLDRVFLGSMTSFRELGVFAVSSSVASIYETLVAGFFIAWGPYVLSSFRESWAPKKYADYFGVVSASGIACIILLGLWGSPLLKIIRPDNSYIDIGVYIPWIICGTLIYYLGGYFSPGPSIKKQSYWKFIAFALSAGINAVLNYILIPVYGVLGAGLATAVSSLIAGAFNQIVSNRLYYVPNRWKFSFTFIMCISMLISIFQKAEFMYNINNFSYAARSILTLVLLMCGTIPFYKEIKDSEVLVKLRDKVRHMQIKKRKPS